MTIKFSVLGLFLSGLLLSGCETANIQKWSLNAPAIGPRASASRGTVIGSVESNTKVLGIVPSDMQVFFVVKNPDQKNLNSENRIRDTFTLVNDNLELAATQPGVYALQNVSVVSPLTAYGLGGWRNPDGKAIGVFSVDPGEVIYIGHLVLDPEGMILHLRVDDKFDEMRAKLPQELATRMVKRLISVPSSVTFDTKTMERCQQLSGSITCS
jgi:hypothetical protein